MDATELQKENTKLRELASSYASQLEQSQLAASSLETQLEQVQTKYSAVQKQHAAVQTKYSAAQKQHAAEVQQFSLTINEKQQNIARLEHQIKLLLQKIKGSRQERIDPDQLMLFSLEELEEIASQLQQGVDDGHEDLIDNDLGKGKRRRGRKGKLPSDLPREIVRHELSEEEKSCPCCGESRHEIGVESSEQLELIPAQLKIIQHDRVKYACRRCQNEGTRSRKFRHITASGSESRATLSISSPS